MSFELTNRRWIETLEIRRILSATIYVDAGAPGPSHDGSSWGSAFTDLQPALAAAAAGDEIRVADGIYRPTSGSDRSATFALKSGVSVMGGFAGFGAADPDHRDPATYRSELSGNLGNPSTETDNSYHVVTSSGTDATAVLDGFLIYAGTATGTGTDQNGGGILNIGGSPTIRNCLLRDNRAASGGGMYNTTGAAPTLINCTFRGNSTNGGAGMVNLNSSPTLIGCVFEHNSANRGDAGAIYNYISSPTLINCAFNGNYAWVDGGAIYCLQDCAPQIINCTFAGNDASSGGAIYSYIRCSPVIVNSTFISNQGTHGSALYNSHQSNATIRNSIFWSNYVGAGSIVNYFEATMTTSHCDFPGTLSGTNNINANPMFVRLPSYGNDGTWATQDDDYGDLRLQMASPCIDAGNNAAVPAGITTDLANQARFVDLPGVRDPGDVVDMGALEYQFPLAAAQGSYLFNASRPSVRLSFNGEVLATSLGAGDLVLQSLTTGQSIDCSQLATLSYQPARREATWAFMTSLLPDGDYRATLAAASVLDAGGNTAGQDYTFDFFVLGGDANRDRRVDVADLGILASRWQHFNSTFAMGNFDYSDRVDVNDLGILATRWQTSLDSPSPPAAPKPTRPTAPRLADQVLLPTRPA
jgi:predicted outer membrane repeat protein